MIIASFAVREASQTVERSYVNSDVRQGADK